MKTNIISHFCTLLSGMIILTMAGGCKKHPDTRPQACISLSASAVTAGTSVTFTDSCSSSGDICYWNFGDGAVGSISMATGKTVTHAYGFAGIFTVVLTVVNGGDTEYSDQTITVTQPAVTSQDFSGSYTCTDACTGSYTMTISISGSSATVSNLGGYGTTVSGTISGFLLTIPDQRFGATGGQSYTVSGSGVINSSFTSMDLAYTRASNSGSANCSVTCMK